MVFGTLGCTQGMNNAPPHYYSAPWSVFFGRNNSESQQALMKKWGNTFFQLLKIGHFYNAVMPAQVGVQKEALHEGPHSGWRGGGILCAFPTREKLTNCAHHTAAHTPQHHIQQTATTESRKQSVADENSSSMFCHVQRQP
mgnify:CR=1 FL=1